MSTGVSASIVDKGVTVPAQKARQISFTDKNLYKNRVEGTIKLTQATNEYDVTHYRIFYAGIVTTTTNVTNTFEVDCPTPPSCRASDNPEDDGSGEGDFYCINGGTVSGTPPDNCICADCNEGYSGDNCHVADNCTASDRSTDNGSNGNFYCINDGVIGGTTGACTCDCTGTGYSGESCETESGGDARRLADGIGVASKAPLLKLQRQLAVQEKLEEGKVTGQKKAAVSGVVKQDHGRHLAGEICYGTNWSLVSTSAYQLIDQVPVKRIISIFIIYLLNNTLIFN